MMYFFFVFFFFKQKTAYEMRISDWSSDVCSSDLAAQVQFHHDRVMTLLDEEAARFRVQVVTDELEFRLGQAQPVDIIRFTPIGVGQQDLGRDLLHDTVRDIRAQRIGRALRAENQEGVLLAVGLQAILGKGAESVDRKSTRLNSSH